MQFAAQRLLSTYQLQKEKRHCINTVLTTCVSGVVDIEFDMLIDGGPE